MDLITGYGQEAGTEAKDDLDEKRSDDGKEKVKGEKTV